MRSRSNSGSRGREADRPQADNQKRHSGDRPNRLFVIGIGPGSPDYLTKRARDILDNVEVIVGYRTYIDLIGSLIEGKEIVSTGMTQEVERVESAIDCALDGRSCAIISSGDPGIYAMAGLVFEICQRKGIPIAPPGSLKPASAGKKLLPIEVVPGIPALCAGASLLGAPLTHDFAVISLSDLLTPWELIEKRLEAAARADFVIVLYNPKSRKRTWQLEKAQQLLLRYRDANTPVGVVVSAMRPNQNIEIVSLATLHQAHVDMQTTIFVGSSASGRYRDFMFTPRGYANKYEIK